MFGSSSHALDSFPDLCLIWVFVKISLNFAVKFSVGVTFIFLLPVEQPANACNAICEINCWHMCFNFHFYSA